jgi:hypothetical protein
VNDPFHWPVPPGNVLQHNDVFLGESLTDLPGPGYRHDGIGGNIVGNDGGSPDDSATSNVALRKALWPQRRSNIMANVRAPVTIPAKRELARFK